MTGGADSNLNDLARNVKQIGIHFYFHNGMWSAEALAPV
jgi:hypothetical protein